MEATKAVAAQDPHRRTGCTQGLGAWRTFQRKQADGERREAYGRGDEAGHRRRKPAGECGQARD